MNNKRRKDVEKQIFINNLLLFQEEEVRQDPAPPRPKENIDFNNTDNMDTPGLPDFGRSEYKPTDVGTYERFVDFRTKGESFSNPDRPSPNDKGLYTDHAFTVDIAVPRVRGLGWKRPGVSLNMVLALLVFVFTFYCIMTTRHNGEIKAQTAITS